MAAQDPANDQKKARQCRGVVAYGDEARLLARRHAPSNLVTRRPAASRRHVRHSKKPRHVFGIITLEKRPRFLHHFAPVFNGKTFLEFLKEVVRRSRRRKTFLIIDNGPCHNLDAAGKLWLAANRHRIELFRLPPYSPELNPIEGVWESDQEADDAQPLLSDYRRARRYPSLDVRHVPSAPSADLKPRRAVPVIHNLRDSV